MIEAEVSLNTGDTGLFISVILNVSLPSVERSEAINLVEDVHQVCPYSKATRGNIEVTFKINGEPLRSYHRHEIKDEYAM